MLNAIGLQNPGVEAVVRKILPTLDFSETRFIANACGSTIEEYVEVTRRFDDSPIDAIEINISCPNVKEGGVQFGNVPGTVALRSAKEVTCMAHTGPKPVDVLPGIPGIAEVLPGFETWEWNGVFVPAVTAPGLIAKLNTEMNVAFGAPATAARLAELGALTRPNTPAAWAFAMRSISALRLGSRPFSSRIAPNSLDRPASATARRLMAITGALVSAASAIVP